ncbi:MAG TPA: hypothetical protein VGG10_18065 [Rhizomicrobium sp.]|jgi:hypothetical protein
MKPSSRVVATAAAATLCLVGIALADDDDYPSWRPNNTPANSVTGPIILLPNRMHAADADFPLHLNSQLPDFKPGQGSMPASVYAVTARVDSTLLNGQKLCSTGLPPVWIVVVPVPPDGLEVDAFNSIDKPVNASSPGLCGTFSYIR